jgi:hypothetical protein
MWKVIAFACLLTQSLWPLLCTAEVVCRSEVSFKWKAADADKEQEIRWATVERGAEEEKAARALVSEEALQEVRRAEIDCRKLRENLSDCIAAKFVVYKDTLNSMTFSGRKALEQAITKDCEKQQGKCLGASVTEAVCEEKAAAGAKGKEKEGDKKGDAKGAKKGEKK